MGASQGTEPNVASHSVSTKRRRWWWPGSAPEQTILMGLSADSWNNSLDVLRTLNVLHALPHILNVLQTCSHARDHIDALHGHLGLKERKYALTAFTYKLNVGLNISVLLDLVRQLSCCLKQKNMTQSYPALPTKDYWHQEEESQANSFIFCKMGTVPPESQANGPTPP